MFSCGSKLFETSQILAQIFEYFVWDDSTFSLIESFRSRNKWGFGRFFLKKKSWPLKNAQFLHMPKIKKKQIPFESWSTNKEIESDL